MRQEGTLSDVEPEPHGICRRSPGQARAEEQPCTCNRPRPRQSRRQAATHAPTQHISPLMTSTFVTWRSPASVADGQRAKNSYMFEVGADEVDRLDPSP